MSEKRFEFYSDEDLIGVLDTVTGRTFNSFEIVGVLNEQQSTIEQLQKKLSECQGHKLELTPIPISIPITLKEAEDNIRVTKYEELFDDE